MSEERKEKVDNLTEGVKDCSISEVPDQSPGIVLNDVIKPELLSKWPVLKLKVPAIFLHKPVDFENHVRKVLSMGINFYQPYITREYTKITCQSFNDHKSLMQYFEKKQLPFHTYGHPTKHKMKIIIRGLPIDTDLDRLKAELKVCSIPIIRVHRMHLKQKNADKMLVLAVVPDDDNGKRLLQVVKIFGHDVKLEPPETKSKQCYRCQKWGHSQRYCHGAIKCVKCAGDHSYKKCDRDPEKPPKCVNCGGEHTASFRKCPFCPDSIEHTMTQAKKKIISCRIPRETPKLVTLDNYNKLYKNVKYGSRSIPKFGIQK